MEIENSVTRSVNDELQSWDIQGEQTVGERVVT